MPATTPRQTAEQFLRATISPDPGDLADFYAAQVVIEMPFAPAGLYPARIETTREELRARFRAGAAVRRYRDLRDVVIHETANPGVVIVEYGLDGEMTESAEPFSLRFVMVMTIRDGQIVHTRDYSDPIAGARALGRVPQLLAALTGGQSGAAGGTSPADGQAP
jgi:ketosteroid isomerase-like protein